MLGTALLAVGSDSVAEQPRYGICRQPIEDYVQHRLGQSIDRTRVIRYAERSKIYHPGGALVFVKECDGFHGFEVFGTETACEHIPHYRSGASYVRYEGAYGGCKRAP